MAIKKRTKRTREKRKNEKTKIGCDWKCLTVNGIILMVAESMVFEAWKNVIRECDWQVSKLLHNINQCWQIFHGTIYNRNVLSQPHKEKFKFIDSFNHNFSIYSPVWFDDCCSINKNTMLLLSLLLFLLLLTLLLCIIIWRDKSLYLNRMKNVLSHSLSHSQSVLQKSIFI